MMLLRNDLLTIDGAAMRILAISQGADKAWLISLGDPKALPISVRYSSISPELRLTASNAVPARRYSDTAIRRSKKAWKRIEPLVADDRVLDHRQRNDLILARAREIRCSPTTLLKDLRRFWIGGQTTAALMGEFHNIGRSADGMPRRRRGREPTYGDHETYLVTQDDQKKMDKVIQRYYLKNAVTSVPAAYQRLLENHYSYLDGNQVRHIKGPGEAPSLRQFRYYLTSHYRLEERIRGRQGDKEFERNHRPREGHALQDCLGIGHIYEIDATIADVWLVAVKDRARIIGKPTLYLVYDKFSRLVVGFYAGLEAPSWPAARHAIISIAEDKAALCRRYDVPYDPADWPATGAFPQTFVGDRGEMLSKDSDTLSNNMQIIVKNEPSERPDRKGTVECGFKTIQGSMADSVPGYEPPENAYKRRGKKYDKDACLTLDEFTTILLQAIIKHNRSIMKKYPLPATQISKELKAIPVEIWADDLQRRTGALTRYDETFVRFALLPEDEATVTREGILFRGCYYTCREALKRGWLTKAGHRKFNVKISFDKRLVDSIYIHDDAGDKPFIEATLTSRSSDYKGLSFDEVAAYEYLRTAASHAADHHNAQERSNFHAVVDPLAEKARLEMRQVSTGKSRASKKKDVSQDRIEERRTRRQAEAPVVRHTAESTAPATVVPFATRKTTAPAKDASSLPATDGAPVSLKDRLRQKQLEMLNA